MNRHYTPTFMASPLLLEFIWKKTQKKVSCRNQCQHQNNEIKRYCNYDKHDDGWKVSRWNAHSPFGPDMFGVEQKPRRLPPVALFFFLNPFLSCRQKVTGESNLLRRRVLTLCFQLVALVLVCVVGLERWAPLTSPPAAQEELLSSWLKADRQTDSQSHGHF